MHEIIIPEKRRSNNDINWRYIFRNYLYPIIVSLLLLLILAIEANAYTLTWNYKQGTSLAIGFKIYRKLPTDTSYILLNTGTNPLNPSYNDLSTIPGTCYELSAYNAFGESPRLRTCANIPDGNFLNLGVAPAPNTTIP